MSRLVMVLAAVALVTVACSNDPSDVEVTMSDESRPGIAVSGTGEVEGTPDVLTVSMGISLKRDTIQAALDEGASLATAVIDALKEAGVDEADIQTQQYRVNQEFRRAEGEQVPDGFRVTNVVRVDIREIERAGEIIAAGTEAGGDAIAVQGVRFSLEDDEELVERAREKAWEDARDKAEQLAGLSGQELGPARQISEELQGPGPVDLAQADQLLREDAAAPPVEPGEVSTSVRIEVRFELSG